MTVPDELTDVGQDKGSPKKYRFEPKDYFAITLSTLAFLVSAGNVYLSTLQVEERVSAIVYNSPTANPDDGNNLVVTAGHESNVVFINSGNRPIAITELSFMFADPAEAIIFADPETPCQGRWIFPTNFEPLIVKQGDIVAKKVKINNPVRFPISDINKRKFTFVMQVCLQVVFSTPSVTSDLRAVPVWHYRVRVEGNPATLQDFNQKEPVEFYQKEPAVIVRRVGTLFWWW
jgi:hypothetical protein